MKLEGDQVLLRIHLSSATAWHSRPLYEALVERARRAGLAGATVLKGMAGFVGAGPMLEARGVGVREPRPVVLEIVESAPSVERFLDDVEPMMAGGVALVTTERAHVVHYRSRPR